MNGSASLRVIEQDFNQLAMGVNNHLPVAMEVAAAYAQYLGRGTPESEHRFVIAIQEWQKWKQENPNAEEFEGQ